MVLRNVQIYQNIVSITSVMRPKNILLGKRLKTDNPDRSPRAYRYFSSTYAFRPNIPPNFLY